MWWSARSCGLPPSSGLSNLSFFSSFLFSLSGLVVLFLFLEWILLCTDTSECGCMHVDGALRCLHLLFSGLINWQVYRSCPRRCTKGTPQDVARLAAWLSWPVPCMLYPCNSSSAKLVFNMQIIFWGLLFEDSFNLLGGCGRGVSIHIVS